MQATDLVRAELLQPWARASWIYNDAQGTQHMQQLGSDGPLALHKPGRTSFIHKGQLVWADAPTPTLPHDAAAVFDSFGVASLSREQLADATFMLGLSLEDLLSKERMVAVRRHRSLTISTVTIDSDSDDEGTVSWL